MTTVTYSLEEYAVLVLGRSGPSQIEWMAVRLRRGELPGYKAGRRWRATQADVDAAIESLRPVHIPTIPSASTMTRTSRRRLAS